MDKAFLLLAVTYCISSLLGRLGCTRPIYVMAFHGAPAFLQHSLFPAALMTSALLAHPSVLHFPSWSNELTAVQILLGDHPGKRDSASSLCSAQRPLPEQLRMSWPRTGVGEIHHACQVLMQKTLLRLAGKSGYYNLGQQML